ncbi:hypothetical protein ScPMuIL_001203 [Solemya velum]
MTMTSDNHMRTFYEYIVVGCGGIGSGALYWLSKRVGPDVLGLEQFQLGHERGGSQDYSRIIRMAYPDDMYTKLTPHTYTAWSEVERESGLQLVYRTGGLSIGEKGVSDHITSEYARAMAANNISYENLTGRQLHERYPQFTLNDNLVAVYQKDGGIVDAALGNSVHVQLARGNGATVIDQCPVTRLSRDAGGRIAVHTTKGIFHCRKVLLTAGAWMNHVLGSVGVHIPLYVTQEQVTYFGTPHMKDFTKDRFPMFIYHKADYDIYGLPIHGNSGSKIGIDAVGPVTTADSRTYEPDPVREKIVIDFLQTTLPKYLGPIIQTKTCLYTMTPDRHFVIDTCRKYGWDDVIFCCGAGHAYKFASLLGKILSELAVDNHTQYPISPFTMEREAISNPNYKTDFHMKGNSQSKL